jgi:hypothetical protein
MVGGFAAYLIVRAVVRSPDASVIIRFGVPTLVVGALIFLIKVFWDRLRRQAGSKAYGAAIIAEELGKENQPPPSF